MQYVLAFSGGIGGAKLALGLQQVLPAHALTVVVNTGDDFEHLNLAISPDVDTTLYTLAGLANTETGWGRAAESWNFMAEIERLGGAAWFRLGDKDMAIHVERTYRLATHESPGSIAERFAQRFGLATRVLPMTDDRVRTLVATDEGVLEFQHYFVRRHCKPVVSGLTYAGAATARPNSCIEQLRSNELEAVVICPSNPWLSIDPILAIPAWRSALQGTRAPIVAVSPLIAGQAVKGPTAKIMRELKLEVSALTVARHYGGLIDGFVLDHADAALADQFDVPVHTTQTLMRTLDDKQRLAREVLEFAQSLRRAAQGSNR
jgi:LPPG:FO 2-phospho-L-lactate transferase